jgi:hypothetical protein
LWKTGVLSRQPKNPKTSPESKPNPSDASDREGLLSNDIACYQSLARITTVVQYPFGKLPPTPHQPIINPLWF